MSTMRRLFVSGLIFACVVALERTDWSKGAPNPPGAPNAAELHVVGSVGSPKGVGPNGPKVIVKVDRPEKQVTLVLTSLSPVTWELDSGKGTQIEKVILGGPGRQAVTGLPETTTIVDASSARSKTPLPYASKVDTTSFRQLVQQLTKYSALPIRSFQGIEIDGEDAIGPLVIDKVNHDQRLSADYPKATPLADLPKLAFKAHHYVPDLRHSHFFHVSYGEFTLAGPNLSDLKPLPPRVRRVTFDPIAERYYGIRDHGIVEMDREKKKVTAMELGLDVPELSSPSGITFDTKRRRVLLAGSRYLYSYDPKLGKWSTVSNLERISLNALTYDVKNDRLFGLQVTHDDKIILTQFDMKGAVVKDLKWSASDMREDFGSYPSQMPIDLIARDGSVVLVAPDHLYLIDLEKQKVMLADKR